MAQRAPIQNSDDKKETLVLLFRNENDLVLLSLDQYLICLDDLHVFLMICGRLWKRRLLRIFAF